MTTARIASSHQWTLGRIEDGAYALLSLLRSWLHQDQRSGSEQDDPEHWEDAAHHGQQHLQSRLGGLFLRPLTAAAPHVVGLDTKDLADAGSELFGLDDRLDEVVQVIDT